MPLREPADVVREIDQEHVLGIIPGRDARVTPQPIGDDIGLGFHRGRILNPRRGGEGALVPAMPSFRGGTAPLRFPDGGATVMLLGIALGGLALVQRLVMPRPAKVSQRREAP